MWPFNKNVEEEEVLKEENPSEELITLAFICKRAGVTPEEFANLSTISPQRSEALQFLFESEQYGQEA